MLREILLGVIVVVSFIIDLPLGNQSSQEDKPKIVIGIVIDQMRWDYLYRYQDRYVDGGFNRMLSQGFSCDNTNITYSPTATGPGHACIYTGSVPAIHGIVGNSWYDRSINREFNCVEDTLTRKVGVSHTGIARSPRNLLTTTIGDELKLSNNSKSKVVGVANKDRSSILPGGHMSNGSYWFDEDSGNFITSTFYMDELPHWLNQFNERKLPDQYLSETWEILYPINTYSQSTKDNKWYEEKLTRKDQPVFPYNFSNLNKDYSFLMKSIYGNMLTFEMAKAAIEGEDLGSDEFTDLLAISFSSTDGLGHSVGINAIEIEDMYLRLDKELSDFFRYLDNRFGTNGYLLFMTADHGAMHSPGFLKEHKLPTGVISNDFIGKVNEYGKDLYGVDEVILSRDNFEIYINWDEIHTKNNDVNEPEFIEEIISILRNDDSIIDAWPTQKLATAPWPEAIKKRALNGYNALRGGDIEVIFRSGWKDSETGTTHGLWNPFDSHIPLIWMGWNIPQGYTNRSIGMTDIAPTLAALLKVQMPSGNVGEPILEIIDKE